MKRIIYINRFTKLLCTIIFADGKEEYSKDNVEILVLNAYGSALGFTVS